MAKCVRLYSDSSSELAKSESGKWFYREWVFNPYIKYYTWSKWVEIGELNRVERSTVKYENLNGNEITQHNLRFEFDSLNSPLEIFYFKLSQKRDVKGLKYRLPN